jgi:hypothetical protein
MPSPGARRGGRHRRPPLLPSLAPYGRSGCAGGHLQNRPITRCRPTRADAPLVAFQIPAALDSQFQSLSSCKSVQRQHSQSPSLPLVSGTHNLSPYPIFSTSYLNPTHRRQHHPRRHGRHVREALAGLAVARRHIRRSNTHTTPHSRRIGVGRDDQAPQGGATPARPSSPPGPQDCGWRPARAPPASCRPARRAYSSLATAASHAIRARPPSLALRAKRPVFPKPRKGPATALPVQ